MQRLLALTLAIAILAGCNAPSSAPDKQPTSQPPATPSQTPATPSQTPTSSPTSAPPTPSTTASPPGGQLRLVFVDVGQGAGIVIHFPDGITVVDAGNRATASREALLGHLNSQGVTTIDNLVISNPDADHAASCNELFQTYTVRHFYHQGSPKDTDTWRECLAAADAEQGLVIHTDADLNPGDALDLSSVATARLLSINANAASINAGSIAFRVDFGEFSFLLPGDIECAVEDQIIAGPLDLDVDVLQAGHHGSKTSTCTPWLDATSPEAVAIPVGTNSYGHPTPETLGRISDAGAKLYRTDLNGTITFTSDGTSYTVSVEKAPGNPSPPTTSTPAPTPSTGLEIVHIEYAPAGNDQGDNLANEYVEIHNGGTASVSFSGYTLKDAAGTTFTFPSTFNLAPAATVKVRTGTGTDSPTDLHWGRGSAVWNNDHDTATLLASGTVVAEKSY